jgi:hypothetical protein
MNLPSILVLMLSLLGIIVISIPLLFSMCHPSYNWPTSSLKRKLESNIGFICSNSMLQILHFHLEFEGGGC